MLTEGLREDPTLGGLGLFALLYGAIWLSWVSVVLYANVAGERTGVSPVVWSMFLVAVMAASAPAHFEARANLFAGAFLLVRATAARGSISTGRVLQGWPLLQLGGLATPWIVAMWVDVPWKYALWAVALLADLATVLLRGGTAVDQQVERLRERMNHGRGRSERRGEPRGQADLEVVDVETAHLDERLGLFMIIVLGEAVSQLVLAGATTRWTWEFVGPATLGFLTLVGLWWLTFSYGFTAAPHSRLAQLPPRFALPLHLATTFGVVCLAAGLGEIVFHPDETLTGVVRWVMCSGLALHFLVTGIGGLAAGAPRRWLLGCALPCTLVPLAVAPSGLANGPLVLVLLACVAWAVLFGRVARARAALGV